MQSHMVSIWVFLVLQLASQICFANPETDRITHLPGLEGPAKFNQYSGYLHARGSRKLFYWFVESQNDPENDPMVLWLNGGPGCSSLTGFLTENGPYRIKEDGKTVVYNPYSWNRISNMLFVESPAGVGFSYSKEKEYATDDDQTAEDNYLALKDFFRRYPRFKKHDFYITGESYAGIYVPTLVSKVVDDDSFNFKGMAIGNGVTDWEMLDNSLVYFAFYHGLIGRVMWADLVRQCCVGGNSSNCNFFDNKDRHCQQLVNEVSIVVNGIGLNRYNLFAPCAGGAPSGEEVHQQVLSDGRIKVTHPGWLLSNTQHYKDMIKKIRQYKPEEAEMSIPCTDTGSSQLYLNSQVVRDALHVVHDTPRWDSCSNVVSNTYKSTYKTMRSQYLKVLGKGYRVLVYNGDADMACNFLGDQWFVDSLGLPEERSYKEWYYRTEDGISAVGGWARQFKNLVFLTVRGSGHMVPTDRPVSGYEMYRRFLNNQPFPGE